MKLVNKKTGEVATLTLSSNGEDLLLMKNDEMVTRGVKLSDLEKWEDYEEAKEYWYICSTRNYEITRVVIDEGTDFERVQKDKEIGNYFKTMEEAEKAVEKLKAWKRLKDKGFEFLDGYLDNNDDFIIKAKLGHVGLIDQTDVHLLFGGE